MVIGSEENREDQYRELLANIRRLTILVLNDFERSVNANLLDGSDKRLLSSSATRLLRLWRTVLREGWSKSATNALETIGGQVSSADNQNYHANPSEKPVG